MQASVKEERWKYIGGSDIPAILGISPYKTRFQLLLEKAQYATDDFDGNEFTEYGNVMEEKIRDHINSMGGYGKFVEGKHVEEGDPIGIRVHTDGESETFVLEVKTTSHIYDDVYEYEAYLSQLIFGMMKAEKPYGLLAVYERPEDMSEKFEVERLHLYAIRMDNPEIEAFVDRIERAVLKFKEDLRIVLDNPFITEEELMPSDLVNVSNKIVSMEKQLAEMKKLEKDIKKMKGDLKKLMEAYCVKSWDTPGGVKITLVEDTPPSETTEEYFDLESFTQDHPKYVKQYTKEKVVKKNGRAGYVLITLPKGKED